MYSHVAAVYSPTLLHHVATRSNLWFHGLRSLRHFPKVVAFVVVLQQVVAPSCCWYEIKSYLVFPPSAIGLQVVDHHPIGAPPMGVPSIGYYHAPSQ